MGRPGPPHMGQDKRQFKWTCGRLRGGAGQLVKSVGLARAFRHPPRPIAIPGINSDNVKR